MARLWQRKHKLSLLNASKPGLFRDSVYTKAQTLAGNKTFSGMTTFSVTSPTVPSKSAAAGNNPTVLATEAQVALKADLAGATFTDAIAVPNKITAVTNNGTLVATEAQVYALSMGANPGLDAFKDSVYNKAQTLDGVKTFIQMPTQPSQTAKYVLAGPTSGNAAPSFRELAASDIPPLNQNTTGNAGTATALETARTISAGGASPAANIVAVTGTPVPFDGTAAVYLNGTVPLSTPTTAGAMSDAMHRALLELWTGIVDRRNYVAAGLGDAVVTGGSSTDLDCSAAYRNACGTDGYIQDLNQYLSLAVGGKNNAKKGILYVMNMTNNNWLLNQPMGIADVLVIGIMSDGATCNWILSNAGDTGSLISINSTLPTYWPTAARDSRADWLFFCPNKLTLTKATF
ncbi:hypothetical protein AGMMS49525_16080 [Bacteroidia bacterium]|nr:hypothetical protein AGMMS49525_16080 [Bacteroidia bacterium]